ncbi:hypothetical protein EI067_14915 [Mycobacterium paragordonae]|nr:hypothetical protein EI067_14915 [Mycobacterium paragordonae]
MMNAHRKEICMASWKRPAGAFAIAALALTGAPEMFDIGRPPGKTMADVCVNAGRRISVSGCTNIADAVAPYAPPPTDYAPLPEDYPPPPPPPNINVCANVGRRVTISGCV